MLFNIFFKSFFKKKFAKRKNISTFAENSDNEPTALATDVGKPSYLAESRLKTLNAECMR